MSIDYAITLVKSQAEATVLNASDLQYVHNQLCTEKRDRPWANPPSNEGKDRCFVEVESKGGHKLMHFSRHEAWESQQDEKKLIAVRWVKVAPVEEF